MEAAISEAGTVMFRYWDYFFHSRSMPHNQGILWYAPISFPYCLRWATLHRDGLLFVEK
jgi:hypothetical protein